MDPINGIASVLTLIQAAAILAGATLELARRFRKAYEELNALAAQLLHVQSELGRTQHAASHGHRALFTDDIRRAIEETLIELRDGISAVENICERAQGNERFMNRIQWLRSDRHLANEALGRIRIVRERLATIMRDISCRADSLILTGVDDIKTAISTLVEKVEQDDETSCSDIYELELALPKKDERRQLCVAPWSFGSSWAVLGVKGSVIPTKQGAHRDYFMALQVSMPVHRIVGAYVLIMTVSVRTFPLCPNRFKILQGSSLALARVVPENDPFMVACDLGDLIAVRTMLQSGQGRPSDIIDKNWTPLAFAIKSGSIDVVNELLDNGADIDATLGVLQTTPLQWAIWHKQPDVTRLLLSRGASQDHINQLGWNTTFFCWPKLEPGEQCMLDFLHMLAEDSYQDLDVADIEGWAVLHRVAAYGTPAEVTQLIKLGARPTKIAKPLEWDAVYHAVFYGNYATFEILAPLYSNHLVQLTDVRGWTLLHVAASAGHDEIVRYLLRNGADPNARSKPFMSHMPESLFKRACTPQEVAAAQSPKRERRYLDIVDELGIELDFEFWDAQETLA